MSTMKSTHITSVVSGEYCAAETYETSEIFRDSRFFPAKDGTWLMVDWISDSGNWYVTEGAM